MNIEKYQNKYEELYSTRPREHKISTEPKHSYWEAIMKVGPMSVEKAMTIFNELYYSNGRERHNTELYQKYPDSELIVAALGPGTTKNKALMLDLIKAVPRAYLYVHPSINDEEFRQLAVRKNHSVYLLLTDEQRKEHGLLSEYRRACVANSLSPNRNIDPNEYYSAFAFKEVYKDWVLGNHDVSSCCHFMQMAEKLNPELQEQYDQAKEHALIELSYASLGHVIYVQNVSRIGELMSEIEQHRPSLNQTVLREYRERNKDALIANAYNCHNERDYTTEWRADLREDLMKWPETRGDTINIIETNLRMAPKPNSSYHIDQSSLYAQIAKEALMHYKGLSEREAVAILRNSTYEQIESQFHIKSPIVEAARAIGETIGVKKEWINHFERSLIDHRDIGRGPLFMSDGVPGRVLDMLNRNKEWADRVLGEAAIKALRAINENRTLSSVNNQQQPDLQKIKALEMKDDMFILDPICKSLGIQINESMIIKEYENRNYEEKYQWLIDHREVDNVVDFINENKNELAQAIAEGKISIQDIALALGINYQEPDSRDISSIDTSLDIVDSIEGPEVPGNR